MTIIIKVANRSRTVSVAGSIAATYRKDGHANIQAIGAGAVNQAVKAIIIAKGYLADEGINIFFVPSFVDVQVDGAIRTAIRLAVGNFITQPSKSISPSTNKAILIIDDEPDMRQAVAEILGILPETTIYTAADGQEGLQIFSQHQKQIILVLLDMNMPIMNGYQTYEGLLQLNPHVKVIVVSSLEKAEAQTLFGKQLLPTFLQKPYKVQTLLDLVQTTEST